MRKIVDLLTKRNCFMKVNQGLSTSIQFNDWQK